jgi:hypothetical protein
MTTDEITQAFAVGAVKFETFVFRTGMANWVTLLEATELAEALARAGAEVPDAYRSHATELGQLSPSSMPPPRKPLASQAAGGTSDERSEASRGGGEDNEESGLAHENDAAGEGRPFNVAERANGKLVEDEGEDTAAPRSSQPPSSDDQGLGAPAAGRLDDEGSGQSAPLGIAGGGLGAPLATTPLPGATVESGGDAGRASPPVAPAPASSSAWIWIVVVLVALLAVAAFYLAPRFGFSLR